MDTVDSVETGTDADVVVMSSGDLGATWTELALVNVGQAENDTANDDSLSMSCVSEVPARCIVRLSLSPLLRSLLRNEGRLGDW